MTPTRVLDAAINIKNRFIAPRWVLRFGCKGVPVVLVTASPDHAVDAGSTAQNLSHAHRNGAAIEVWVWPGVELPISLASDIRDPLAGIRDTGYIVVAAGLKQQDTYSRVFRETTCNCGPRRA